MNCNKNIKKKVKGRKTLSTRKIDNVTVATSLLPRSGPNAFLYFNHALKIPTLLLQSANSYIVDEVRINDLYAPYSTQTPDYYAPLALMYNHYRVEKIRFKFEIVTNEPSVPVNFGIVCRDGQPSLAVASYANAVNILEAYPTTGSYMLGQTTGMSVFRSKWYEISMSQILGSQLEYEGSASFRGGSATSPTQLLWLGLVAYSRSSASALTNGLFVDLHIEFLAKWYSPITIVV